MYAYIKQEMIKIEVMRRVSGRALQTSPLLFDVKRHLLNMFNMPNSSSNHANLFFIGHFYNIEF